MTPTQISYNETYRCCACKHDLPRDSFTGSRIDGPANQRQCRSCRRESGIKFRVNTKELRTSRHRQLLENHKRESYTKVCGNPLCPISLEPQLW